MQCLIGSVLMECLIDIPEIVESNPIGYFIQLGKDSFRKTRRRRGNTIFTADLCMVIGNFSKAATNSAEVF